MPFFAVQYTYDARTDHRDRVRPEHRRHLRGLVEEGVLLASGPYAGPTDGAVDPEPDGALLLVRAASAEEVGRILDADPFAVEGLVAGRAIRPWQPVLGPWA